MNNLNHIKELLDKFYSGETNLAEEAEIQEYFEGSSIPEELLEEQQIFLSVRDAKKPIDVPITLDEKIQASIKEAEASEYRTRRITIYSLSGLAAGLLIILSVYMGMIRNGSGNNQMAQYTIEDPAIAYEEIKRTLNYISEKWDEGTEELKPLENVNKSMKSIQPIQKLSSGSKELNLLGNLRKTDEIKYN